MSIEPGIVREGGINSLDKTDKASFSSPRCNI